MKITNSRSLADMTIQQYLKKGYIKRVKKNLYVTISLENNGVIPTKFEIASNVTPSSFVSHHSAFDFYGFSNQVYNEITVSSLEQFRDFTFQYNDYHYKYIKNIEFVDIVNGVRVSTLAKTIVDCIDDIKSYDEMEEVIQNLSALPIINGLLVMEYLLFVNKKILFNKVGLLLSFFKDGFNVTEHLLIRMKKSGIKNVKYFTSEKHRLNKYYKEWNLYSYNINKLVMGDEDDNL
jgi:predicted transcriptional regulator of viral defense system